MTKYICFIELEYCSLHVPGSKLLVLGMGDLQPLMTGILISWVYFHPYEIGLSFPSPTVDGWNLAPPGMYETL